MLLPVFPITNILINLIINNYFNNSRCLFIITDENHEIDYKGNMPVVNIRIINNTINSSILFHYFGCQGILIQSENPMKIFADFETAIRLNIERFNTRRFLINHIIVDNDSKYEDFFNLNELNYVSDILLIIPRSRLQPNQNNSLRNVDDIFIAFDLLTHRYAGVENHNEPVLLDKWFLKNSSFLYNANLYPNKLSNQLGRPLRMATFTYEPYSIIGTYHGNICS